MAEDVKVGSAKDYRQRLARPVALPSGAVWLLKRPRLDLYLSSGRVPQALMQEGMKAWKETDDGQLALEEATEAIAEQIQDGDKAAELFVFMRELVCDAVVKPRIVENADPTSDDEIDPSEIDAEDFAFVINWITQGLGPIQTAEGEVSPEGIKKTNTRRPRTSSRSRKSVRKVQEVAK